jgi:uncharacterized alpha-E superfamily protein
MKKLTGLVDGYPRSVCVKLTDTDRANLRMIMYHYVINKAMPGRISISSAIRYALHEQARQIRETITREAYGPIDSAQWRNLGRVGEPEE